MSNALNKRVSILMKDRVQAQEFSLIFRPMGIVPEHYDTLRDFWRKSLTAAPLLSIIDVQLMSEGETVYKNHPLVKIQKLPCCFYYEEENGPLLLSTFELASHGYINGRMPLKGQIKAILKRANYLNAVLSRNEKLSAQNREAEKKLDQLTWNIQEQKEEQTFLEKLLTLRTKLMESKIHGDFFTAVGSVFDSWDDISHFSFLELSLNGEKLISPKMASSKYKELPSLFLSKACHDGIEFFAQNLASKVALDVIGGDLMPLLIKGTGEFPEKLAFVQVTNEEILSRFEWGEFEWYLTSLYSYLALQDERLALPRKNVLGPWELLSILDDFSFGSATGESQTALLLIDFSKIMEKAQAKKRMRFFWGKFYNDFFSKLERTKRISFQISQMAMNHTALLVSREKFDEIFKAIQDFAESFPVWRYFEETDLVIAENLRPSLKEVPFSSKALYGHLAPSQEKTPPVPLVWGPPPEQSM